MDERSNSNSGKSNGDSRDNGDGTHQSSSGRAPNNNGSQNTNTSNIWSPDSQTNLLDFASDRYWFTGYESGEVNDTGMSNRELNENTTEASNSNEQSTDQPQAVNDEEIYRECKDIMDELIDYTDMKVKSEAPIKLLDVVDIKVHVLNQGRPSVENFKVELSEVTVGKLCDAISARLMIQPSRVRLIFRGRPQQDMDKSLADIGVEAGSALHSVIRSTESTRAQQSSADNNAQRQVMSREEGIAAFRGTSGAPDNGAIFEELMRATGMPVAARALMTVSDGPGGMEIVTDPFVSALRPRQGASGERGNRPGLPPMMLSRPGVRMPPRSCPHEPVESAPSRPDLTWFCNRCLRGFQGRGYMCNQCDFHLCDECYRTRNDPENGSNLPESSNAQGGDNNAAAIPSPEPIARPPVASRRRRRRPPLFIGLAGLAESPECIERRMPFPLPGVYHAAYGINTVSHVGRIRFTTESFLSQLRAHLNEVETIEQQFSIFPIPPSPRPSRALLGLSQQLTRVNNLISQAAFQIPSLGMEASVGPISGYRRSLASVLRLTSLSLLNFSNELHPTQSPSLPPWRHQQLQQMVLGTANSIDEREVDF